MGRSRVRNKRKKVYLCNPVREEGRREAPARCGREVRETSRRGIGSSLKRLDRDSTREVPKNRERQFEVEIPELKMEPRDTA